MINVVSLGVFSVASLKYGHASVDDGTWKLCAGARILINGLFYFKPTD